MRRSNRFITIVICILILFSVTFVTGCAFFDNLFGKNKAEESESATATGNAYYYTVRANGNTASAYASAKATSSAKASSTATSTPTPSPKASPTVVNGKTCYLTFEDNFDGTSLDRSTWYCETGTGWGTQAGWGWGNEELEYYSPANAVVSNGTLKIIAVAEDGGESYKSARINTINSFSQTYGRFEARIKLPAEQGMWPAFWLLPKNNTYHTSGNTWPYNGEIDIMEAKGRFPTKTSCAVHSANGSGQDKYSSKWYEASGFSITDFHVYAVEWTATKMDFYVDNVKIYTVNSSSWHGSYYSSYGSAAPFDRNFYIILNLAVGGKFDKEDGQNVLPRSGFTTATMEVDYVRVYQFA